MMKFIRIAIAITSLSCHQVEGYDLIHCLGPHTLFLGPEVCHITRTRDGGSKQSGYLLGGHFRYDRISPGSLYWAVDGYYLNGQASGKTASGRKIKSSIDEYEIQARLGYSLYFPKASELLIIPYGGYSYFYGSNEFIRPSPVVYKLHDRMHFGALGAWISFCVAQNCRVGVDFAAKYMLIGKNKVTDDPDFDQVSLEIESKWQYEIDVPIEFTLPVCDCDLEFRFVPYYRFRHFGGKPNYPFDFFETKFNIYGARFLINVGF